MAREATLEKATLWHARELAPVLRKGDLEEILASGFTSGLTALEDSIRLSEHSWALRFDGELVAIAGLRYMGATLLGRKSTAACWLLTGEAVNRHPKTFIQVTKAICAAMLLDCPRLENWVDSRYEAAIRWLRALGFTVEPPSGLGPTGVYFCRFYKEA